VGTEAHRTIGHIVEASIEPGGRAVAFGNQLIEIHLDLREKLARLRAQIEDGPPQQALARDLRAHCVAFCSAVTRHHTGEDAGAFAVLARDVPELRPALDELERDHRIVAGILRRLEDQLDASELDGLAALLESHFVYEEKKLVAALNSLDTRAGTAETLLGWPIA
jgi:hypothetical protein